MLSASDGSRRPRVLFRVAGGPRRGFGHVIRALRLAEAMGVRAALSVRGSDRCGDVARWLGARLLSPALAQALRTADVDVLVVDDPNPATARRAIDEARRSGLVTVSIHDLGIGCLDADHLVDGSIARPRNAFPHGRGLVGPRYAIVDPRVAAIRAERATRRRGGAGVKSRVLIALGGGSRLHLANRVAQAITRRLQRVEVLVAGGFLPRDGAAGSGRRWGSPGSTVRAGGITWLGPRPTLALDLSAADVVVVAGGVTLYEALALGVPCVAAAIVEAQRPTVAGFVRLGAVVDGGRLFGPHPTGVRLERIADTVEALLGDASRSDALSLRGRGVVDGRGAERVAARIARWWRQSISRGARVRDGRRRAA